MLGDVTITSCEIVDYFNGGLSADLDRYLRIMIKDCAFIGSRQNVLSVLGLYRPKIDKNLIVLWNVSVLYNEAFPDRSVAWLTNVHNIFLIDCYFIGNKWVYIL